MRGTGIHVGINDQDVCLFFALRFFFTMSFLFYSLSLVFYIFEFDREWYHIKAEAIGNGIHCVGI